MASDNKIWIWGLFLLVSFIFNLLKKKNKEVENQEEGSSKDGGSANLGLEELIRQFGEKYGAVTEEEVPIVRDMENLKVEVSEEKEVPVSRYSENINVSENKREVNSVEKNGVTNIEETQPEELDLKQMIISNTILKRPEY